MPESVEAVDPPPLTALFGRLATADLAGDIATELEPAQLIDRVLRRAVSLVPGAEESALSIRAGAAGGLSFCTGPIAQAHVRLEQGVSCGPLACAEHSQEPVRADDLRSDPRWPLLADAATPLGHLSVLAYQLPTEQGPKGSLALVATRRAAFPPAAERLVLNVANRVAVVVAHLELMQQLRGALRTRQTIGQACGILMERHRVTADQAFDRLARASQRNHVPLRDLAARLIDTGEEPESIRSF